MRLRACRVALDSRFEGHAGTPRRTVTDIPSTFHVAAPPRPGDDRTTTQRIEDELARRVYRVVTVVDAIAIVVYLLMFAWRAQWPICAVIAAQLLPLALALRLARRRRRHVLALLVILWPSFVADALLAWAQGGAGSVAAWWLIVPPTVLIQAGALRSAVAMIAVAATELIACHALRQAGLLPLFILQPPPGALQVAIAVFCSMGSVVATVWMGVRWRRELLQELDALRTSAEEATRVKSRFIANMSHEIRTPLNGIVGAAELLRLSTLDAAQMQAAQIIDHSAHALLSVVNDVLDFSKLEAGRVELERIELDPCATAYDTAETFGGQAHARGVELWAHAAGDVPATIHSDPVRLRQILHNLVSNALKFTEHGEIRIEVSLLPAVAGGRAQLRYTVRDTGIGLDVAQQARLFHAFTQADVSTTRRFGGTGLGLAICRDLTQLLGGRLELDSAPGVGSTFSLLLPLPQADLPLAGAAPPWRDGVDDNGFADTAAPRHGGARPALLLCAASPALRDDLRDWAGRAGYVATATATGTPDDWIACARAIDAVAIVADDEALRASGLSRGAWAGRLHQGGLAGVLLLGVSVPVAAVPVGLVPLYKPARPQRLAAAVHEALRVRRDAAGSETGDSTAAAAPGARASPDPATAPTGRAAALPIDPPSARPVDAFGAAPPPVGDAAGALRAKVLLVEDNPVNQAVATALLGQLRIASVIAPDGSIALEMLMDDGDAYAAVLMDCQMPVLDGFAATRAWREHEGHVGRRRLPVIAMTANSVAEAGAACMAAGMDDFVAKPFTLNQLERVLERWIHAPSTQPLVDQRSPEPSRTA